MLLKTCSPSLHHAVTSMCATQSHVLAEQLMDELVTGLSAHTGAQEEDVSPIKAAHPARRREEGVCGEWKGIKCGSFLQIQK